jgi:hypothetical protein
VQDPAAAPAQRVRRLVVAYGFAPSTDTSAVVMAKRVLADGVPVDVVSQDLSSVSGTDPGLASLVAPLVRRQAVLGGEPEYGGWATIRRFVSEGLDAVARLELEAGGSYAEVRSRAMWPAAHFLAARYRLLTPDAVWTAEFSDPLLHTVAGEQRRRRFGDDDVAEDLWQAVRSADPSLTRPDNVWEMVELLPYAVADSVVFTNELQREHMLGYCRSRALAERARERSIVSPHPSPPAAAYSLSSAALEREPGTVAIGYFGVFYPTRGLTEVWDALAALREDERARLRLHVFTSDPAVLAEQLLGTGLEGVVLPREYVPYLDFLHLATQLDVLLVGDARTAGTHDVNPYLPSKWSDYAGSGTPVWAVSEPGSVLSGLPATYGSSLGDADGAVRVLREILAR